jgi:hypothetical protein
VDRDIGVPGENERNSSEITLGSANLFLRYSPSVFTPMETHKISPHVQGSSFGDLQSWSSWTLLDYRPKPTRHNAKGTVTDNCAIFSNTEKEFLFKSLQALSSEIFLACVCRRKDKGSGRRVDGALGPWSPMNNLLLT